MNRFEPTDSLFLAFSSRGSFLRRCSTGKLPISESLSKSSYEISLKSEAALVVRPPIPLKCCKANNDARTEKLQRFTVVLKVRLFHL